MKKLLIALAMVASSSVMAGDIEEPQWELVGTLDKVEVRHYAPSIQAVTEISSSAKTSAGFRRLAGYIFGGNERSQSIAMTAPVQESLLDDRPLMRSPCLPSTIWNSCRHPLIAASRLYPCQPER